MGNKTTLTKKEIADLKVILREYLEISRKTKKHRELHKNEQSCPKCKLVDKLIIALDIEEHRDLLKAIGKL